MKHLRIFDTVDEQLKFDGNYDVISSNLESNTVNSTKGIEWPPDDEIWYTTTDGNIANSTCEDDSSYIEAFGANFVSNTYSNGKGIIKFDNKVIHVDYYSFIRVNNLLSLIFPKSVQYVGVCAIGQNANLESVMLPEGLTQIGEEAFSSNPKLCNVRFPSTLTEIYYNAFRDCVLTRADLSSALTLLESYAFVNNKITHVYIPENLVPENTNVIAGAFSDCPLSSIKVSPNNSKYDSRNDCNAIIETATNTLVKGCKNTVIPDTVVNIAQNAFADSNIKNFNIPDSVTTIGNSAFRNCKTITSVNISENITSLGNYIFNGCSNITNVSVSSNNSKYDSRNNCNAIIETSTNTLKLGCKNTVIPDTVVNIGERSLVSYSANLTLSDNIEFFGLQTNVDGLVNFNTGNHITQFDGISECKDLKSIIIGNGITELWEQWIDDCPSLESVYIGDSVSTFNTRTIWNCPSLKSIVVSPNNSTYDSRNNCNAVIKKSNNALFRGCSTTVIPEGVVTLSNFCFERCPDLTSLTVPSTVTKIRSIFNIGDDVVCNVHTMTILATNPPQIEETTLYYCPADCNFYVPAASVQAYKSAEWWSERADHIFAISE